MYLEFILLVLLIELSLFIICVLSPDSNNTIKNKVIGKVVIRIEISDPKTTDDPNHIQNDFDDIESEVESKSLDKALTLENNDEFKAALIVNDWVDDLCKNIKFNKNYNIHINGHVIETSTGQAFTVDRYLSNNQ